MDEINADVLMCKRCGKWRTKNPGNTRGEVWQHAELESGELLGIALKQGGVAHAMEKGGLEFVDARWEWTEPHCRRLRARVTVRKHLAELPNGNPRMPFYGPRFQHMPSAIAFVDLFLPHCPPPGGVTLQASTSVEFKVNTRQCVECAGENASGDGEQWRALVQLRQRVEHKRTLMWLEQEVVGRCSKGDGGGISLTQQGT